MKDEDGRRTGRIIRGLDNAADGVALFELDGTFIYCNRAWKRIHRLDPDEDYAGENDSVIDMEELSGGIAEAKEILRGGGGILRKMTLEVEGEKRTYKISADMIRDDGDRMVLVIFRDVTDLEKTEEAVKEMERKYRTISEMTSDYTFVARLTPGGALEREWVGGAYESITGYTEEELNEMLGDLSVIHPLDRETVHENFLKVARGEDVVLEFRLLAKDGGTRWVLSRARPVEPSADGLPRGMITVKDITGRKTAEIELERRNRELFVVNRIREIFDATQQRHEIFARILDSILEKEDALGAGVAEIDYDSGECILTIERNVPLDFIKHFGRVSLDDENLRWILGKKSVMIIEEELEKPDDERRKAKKGWGVRRTVAFQVSVGDRPVAVFLIGYAADRDIEPEKKRFFGIIRDQIGLQLERMELLRDREKYQEQLSQLTDSLIESLEQERNMMALKLHDEIGQAIVALNGELFFLENMIDSGDNDLAATLDKIREQLRELTKSTRRMSYALHPSMLDDLGLVPTLRWYIDKFIEKEGLEVDLMTAGFDGKLTGETALTLYRVAQEALTNAVRHAGAGRVTVKLTRGYPDMIMVIEDDGKGFSRTGDEARKKGLGIVSMRQRVERIGGRFRIASAPGKGTRVRAEIPLEVDDG